MNNNFKNRLVMVTAGSRGIGYAAVEAFYNNDARIAVCARNIDNIKIDSDRIFKQSGDIKDPLFLKTFHASSIDFFVFHPNFKVLMGGIKYDLIDNIFAYFW